MCDIDSAIFGLCQNGIPDAVVALEWMNLDIEDDEAPLEQHYNRTRPVGVTVSDVSFQPPHGGSASPDHLEVGANSSVWNSPPDARGKTLKDVLLSPPVHESSTQAQESSARSSDEEESSTTESKTNKKGRGSPRPRKNKKPVFWTEEEHEVFMKALHKFGEPGSFSLGPGVAEMVSIYMGTRSVSQIRSHAQKCALKAKDPKATQ
eukprot:3687464-Rhodomonas_salina.3